ncbi:hypothetical protein JOB18_037835 [Solea senegalensis]|uniref:LITAF domain-containing protein n=1 Tax=Solea senegalensis TaxID=28829 RepID=A0AAV6QBH9_SOLSE|nr:lipopolysaccharide-induced tumor necrosis factor-alpha factor homolog [Solea senegalensis]KAG7486745.1 hypothetical protein JOB18_037835 [Solea senegalensis]KAG7486746.1 hypothetical protein JOB18_037835 [Solea senegalensis]KAG7486747.1 hypothetical protein JOB18_037835 [Solea senegalensis]
MEPPSYEEANLHPSALRTGGFSSPPPPSYYASLSSPSTPPPTYVEAVTTQPDPFPVLSVHSVPTTQTSPPQNAGNIIHPVTQVGAGRRHHTHQTQPAVVVIQPPPVPISVTYLRDIPGLVRCPHCHHTVTTQVTYLPGKAAWCMCVLLSVMGLVCGFCLIPLLVRGMQDAYHSCPQCGNNLHVYKR